MTVKLTSSATLLDINIVSKLNFKEHIEENNKILYK